MDNELLPAENAWMQGSAGTYAGRKRVSEIFLRDCAGLSRFFGSDEYDELDALLAVAA